MSYENHTMRNQVVPPDGAVCPVGQVAISQVGAEGKADIRSELIVAGVTVASQGAK